MGQRLTRIATRTGDGGETGLADGRRVPKDHPRIQALGEVDELNSFIGLLLAEDLPDDIRLLLTEVQQRLFDLGGSLALPGRAVLPDAAVQQLDAALDLLNARLPPLAEFILPGGTRSVALAHVCRAVCRRAERALVTLQRVEPALPESVCDAPRRYLNRLSDLLFVLARVLNQGQGEAYWQSQRMKGD
ncbi:MAG: cob(I)yrinic acid a,c-diamide adenosyltransferase [Burkholderiaceae bacterium]|jgi:cob(I)alamin adenosyltransferase|nr:cob(I)yrinic acid a,c-diamide adenosyltransferase [Burkholderiaceae bacterium]